MAQRGLEARKRYEFQNFDIITMDFILNEDVFKKKGRSGSSQFIF